jgi:cysteine desulfurase
MNAPWREKLSSSVGVLPIYLDNQALTPMDPRVVEAMQLEMSLFRGNPNSVDHTHGDWAARRLHAAAVGVGKLFGVGSGDVRFTASATDALRLALVHAVNAKRGTPLRLAVSTIEHPAVLDMVQQAEQAGAVEPIWLGCDDHARISLDEIARALRAHCDLVCLIAANNEVGTVQALGDIAELVKAHGASLMLDVSQAAGRIALNNADLEADYLIVSGHKLYGPSGIGALIGPDLSEARFSWPAGGHEPTPNLAGAVGLAEACRLRQAEMAEDEAAIAQLRDRLQARILEMTPDVIVNGDLTSRLAGNLHLSAGSAPNDQVVAQLRGKVSISTGAACVSGADAPSHVLRAMGLPAWRQEGALRIGVGKFNTTEEIDLAADAIARAIADVRRG